MNQTEVVNQLADALRSSCVECMKGFVYKQSPQRSVPEEDWQEYDHIRKEDNCAGCRILKALESLK